MSVQEAAWWAAALGGDAAAFNQVFRLHRDAVFGYARRLTASVADADDVTAGVFLELWRRRDAVRLVEGSARAWLLVTCGHIAANQRRGLRRWQGLLASLPREEAGDETDPAVIAAGRVDAQRGMNPLGAALRRLPPVDVGLLLLTVFDGCTVAEAAAVLGLTDATARSRLSRARARLRRHLDPEKAGLDPAVRKLS